MKRKAWLIAACVAISMGSIIALVPSWSKGSEQKEPTAIQVEMVQLPTLFYNIPVDSFQITEGRVKWNQNLSEILSQYNVSYQDLHTLSVRSKSTYDVRKLKAGAKYAVIHKNDSLQTANHFIFEPSQTDYVVYHLGDSIYAELNQKPMVVRERTIAAEISSSLYESILEQESSPQLVNRLVDVFAWQVDFFRIAKGDKFKIIFEEEVVDGNVVGIRQIKGAYFEHWQKPYFAIPYHTGEKTDYFDEEGNSLRKTFLRAPLQYDRISSRFSLRRFHPVQKRYKAHLGTDYAARTGTPIRTVGDGVVLEARYHKGNGNYVKIRHNSNYTTQYLHMSRFAKGIRAGAKVTQGQTIGYVGSTGLATGPHLCFRFWKNGRQVDALKVDLPSSDGIAQGEMEAFLEHKNEVLFRLNMVPFNSEQKLIAELKED